MKAFLTFLFLLFSMLLFGQEEKGTENENEFSSWRIALATINSHVPALEGDARVVVPAWGLEIERKLNSKWAMIGNIEFEMLNYVVSTENKRDLKREFPFIISLLVAREFDEKWILSAGYGREIESHEEFDMIILNFSRKIALPQNWDISPGLTYNARIDGFDTFSLNIAFGKSF